MKILAFTLAFFITIQTLYAQEVISQRKEPITVILNGEIKDTVISHSDRYYFSKERAKARKYIKDYPNKYIHHNVDSNTFVTEKWETYQIKNQQVDSIYSTIFQLLPKDVLNSKKMELERIVFFMVIRKDGTMVNEYFRCTEQLMNILSFEDIYSMVMALKNNVVVEKPENYNLNFVQYTIPIRVRNLIHFRSNRL
jgi:hypothetical protein